MNIRANTSTCIQCLVILFTTICIDLAFPCTGLAQTLPDEIKPYEIAFLTSEHFEARFPKNEKRYAQRALDYAEYIYTILSKNLDTHLKDRITIKLLDRFDDDSYYTSLPETSDSISIYLWPSECPLNNYRGHWFEEEIAHNLARILVQNTETDFIHSFNNTFLPPWYIQGISTIYMTPETPGLKTKHGLPAVIVRTAAKAKDFPEMSIVIPGFETWMGHSIGKIYGTAFLNDLIEQYGLESITQWNLENGSTFANMNSIAEELFGQSWDDLFVSWFNRISNTNFPPIEVEKRLLTTPYRHEMPQLVPNRNAISYSKDSGNYRKSIVLLDLDSYEEKKIIECKGQCEHHWSDDGQTLYFTTRIRTAYYEAETIYSIGLDSVWPQKLPIPGHVRRFINDHGSIIAVTMLEDKPQIYRYDIGKMDEAQLIYTAPPFSLIEGLTVIDKNQWTASYYDPKKQQFDLIKITNHENSIDIESLTNDPTTEMYPFRMQDGRIGYITEENTYYQLHAISPDGSEHELLHIHDTGMIQPVQAQDGMIYYTDVDYKGQSIASMYPSALQKEIVPEPHLVEEDNAPVEHPIEDVEAEYDDTYDASIWIPDLYLPNVGVSDTTGWYLGIYLENDDYLNHHKYNFYFTWYFGGKVFDLDITYKWHQYKWWIETSIGVSQETYVIDAGDHYDNFPLSTYWADITTGSDWHFPLLDVEFSITLLAQHIKANDHSIDIIFQKWKEQSNHLPQDMSHRWTNAIYADLVLKHIHQKPQTIPGKTGYEFKLDMRFEPDFFGNYSYTFSTVLDLSLSWSMPWRDEDALAVSMMYGFALTGLPYRYSLEIESGTGFDFNWFGITELVDFHGIRNGNLLANNHLLHLQLDYTCPIFVLKKNYFRFPISINRIGLGAVTDWALKSDEWRKLDMKGSMYGVGAEIYMDATLMYNYPARILFGYERGFGKAGENAYYLWIGM